MHNLEAFLSSMFDKRTVILEHECGILILRKLEEGLKGEVHMSFFDHKLSAHTTLVKECLAWGFMEFDLQRIGTMIPSYAGAVRRFLEHRLGFKHEGTMRNFAWHKGQLVDVSFYSILREEVFNAGWL